MDKDLIPAPLLSKLSLVVAMGLLWGSAWAASRGPVGERYFRSDGGVASEVGALLPSQLDGPDVRRWRREVDPGHSTPMVFGDRIVLTSYRAGTRELAVEALDAGTGAPVWRRPFLPPKLEELHTIGSPATPTTASDGERVFAFFGSYGLVALDSRGEVLWEKRMGPFQDEYGAGSSPIVVGNRVILLQDHDVGSFLAAYDTRTGKELWRTERPDAVRSYSTPAVWERRGKRELLAAGALELSGYDPETGRRLWTVGGLARIVIPTPIPHGDRVLMASWAPGGDSGRRILLDPWSVAVAKWDKDRDGWLTRAEIDNAEVLDRYYRMDLDQNGKLNESEWTRHADVFRLAKNALLAIRPPDADGPASASGAEAVLWSHARGVPYVATPVVDGGALWMVKDGGIVTRVDAASGVVHYEERLPGVGSYYASPVAGDGKVYFASQAGVVSILSAGPEWKVLSTHDFREKIHATPVLEGGRLLIRTEAAIYCFAVPSGKGR